MNYFSVAIVSAFSIALPAAAAVYRIKRLKGRFIPLAMLFWTGFVNESISYLLIKRQQNNSINSNIYTLIEFLLMLCIFQSFDNGKRKKYVIAAIAGSIIWMTDIFVFHSLFVHNTISRALFSLFIMYLGIDKINETIFSEPGVSKTMLLLWFSFFTYYAYQAFITLFEMFPMGVSNEFYLRLYLILGIINFLTNLVYTIVILWIPKPTEYTSR